MIKIVKMVSRPDAGGFKNTVGGMAREVGGIGVMGEEVSRLLCRDHLLFVMVAAAGVFHIQ